MFMKDDIQKILILKKYCNHIFSKLFYFNVL